MNSINISLVLIKLTLILLLFDLRTSSKICQFEECDCGKIAQPPGSEIIVEQNDSLEPYDDQKEYKHKSQLWYQCIDRNNVLVGNDMRTCDSGKWLGSVPRCGNYHKYIS